MSGTAGIILYEPEELIVVASGEITLAALEIALAEHHQWVPTLVAAEHPEQILSSAVEEDYYNPRAANCGMLRTSILGGSFTIQSGKKFKSGSRVVKSVAGYDIHRAFCGSKGKFGAIETLTLKVQAKPHTFFHFFAPPSAMSLIQQLYPTIIEEYENKLFVELAGYAEDIAYDDGKIRESNLLIEVIDSARATEIIKHIIIDKTKRRPQTNVSEALLSKLISAFAEENV